MKCKVSSDVHSLSPPGAKYSSSNYTVYKNPQNSQPKGQCNHDHWMQVTALGLVQFSFKMNIWDHK